MLVLLELPWALMLNSLLICQAKVLILLYIKARQVVFFTLLLVDLTLIAVWECVLDIKQTPKSLIMIALKRIIKYVKTTADFGVWYNKDTNDVLVGYSDTDQAGNANDRKSTSGGCFYVGNNLVSWMSKKQNSISLSTIEAEYITAGSCCTQLLWMQKLFHDYGICQEHLTIYCDNTGAINISKNYIQHSRTKHIEI